ncbi:MAG: PAS domain S-box protein [Pseudomonadota bacterium]
MSSPDQYTILNQLTDGILIIDQDYTILFANQPFHEFCGTSDEKVKGQKCHAILHHSPFPCTNNEVPDQQCVHRQVFATGLPLTVSHAHTLDDGSIRFLQISASPLQDTNGNIDRILTIIKDITKEKALQDTFNTALIEHKTMLNNAPYYLSYVDSEMRIIKVNASMEKLIGRKSAEIKGQYCYEVWGQYAHDSSKTGREKICDTCRVQYTVTDGRKYCYERQVGDTYVEVTTSPVKDKKGNIIGALECGVDISRRKKMELALQRNEARYATLFNDSPNIMLLIDPRTTSILDANPAACSFYGYDREEWPGMTISDINMFSPEQIQDRIHQIQTKGYDTFQLQHRMKSGEIRDVEIHSGALIINDRQAICATVTDITERLRTEKAIAASKEEWEKTFDAISDIVTIQDMDMRIVRANKAAHHFFQAEPGELKGKHCYELFRGVSIPCPDCPLSATIKNCGNHSGIIIHEKFGKIFQVSSAVIHDETGGLRYLVHIARDITEQKKMEENFYQAQKMEAIGTLAGGIAHDFNNILAAILGFSELAKQNMPPDATAQADINEVIKAGSRAGRLVQQILDFSRKTEQSLQLLQPHQVINETLQMLRSTLPTTIDIKTDINPACGSIKADPTKIHQIVMNLCTNSCQALINEKGTLRVTLSRQEMTAKDLPDNESLSPGPFVVLSVSDSGQGLDAETAAHIFEPYFTTKERGRGTGLGLAVVHGIVEGYKGFIQVESQPGQGCTFRVYLPSLPEDIASPETSTQQEALPFGSERILIVDDEALLVRISQRILEDFGYTVTGTTDSREALALVRQDPQQFNLIVSDQTMPGLSGSELAKAVLEIVPGMPIIICTGHSAITSAEDAYAMGIKKYLLKPVQGDTLARTVRMVLDEQET